jgi:hypothetical protein
MRAAEQRGPETVTHELLAHRNFTPSEPARRDLESGAVDPRLVKSLLALVQEHEIAVSVIKTGHPLGPTAPSGRINDHYYCRAADIRVVDGMSIMGNGADPRVVHVGRLLAALPVEIRPDRIMGPSDWHRCLDYTRDDGFISDPFHDRIHADHLHLGFSTAASESDKLTV